MPAPEHFGTRHYFFLSVAHPPLPLQEFCPAQACFSETLAALALFFLDPSVAQPPVPLHAFLPAQACLGFGAAV